MRRIFLALTCSLFIATGLAQQGPLSTSDAALSAEFARIAAAHHGHLAVYAENLKTGQTAAFDADEPVKTASVIKLAILYNAAQQIRAGKASFDEKLVLEKSNQVAGSGVLAELNTPHTLTLADTLTLMVILSDNTATNLAIDRLGIDHINQTIQSLGLKNTWLYKKIGVPSTEPMPADQPKFGLGKTTAREMATVMRQIVECRLDPAATAPSPSDGPICGRILTMLRHQQDRDSLPRYVEVYDTSEEGSAIGNKTGALDQVRNDIAIFATKNGPIVISAFTWDNKDERWSGDNEAEQTLGKVGEAVLKAWSPAGLDPNAVNWENPLEAAK